MRKFFRARNLLLFVIAAFVVWDIEFAARKNHICSIEDHAIQSETDAIDVARKKIVKDSFFSSRSFGSAHEFEGALDETENCCSATRSRNIFGVIIWRVYLEAKASTKPNRRPCLSRCQTAVK
jgi:hypothetical protein